MKKRILSLLMAVCMAAGIDTGVYFFSQAITVAEAVEEANYVISLLGGRMLTGPVAYDWEMHDSTYRVYGTSSAMATACAKAFCETIEAAGYKAMVIYTTCETVNVTPEEETVKRLSGK